MFAVKVLQKSYLNRHQKMDAIIREKNILTYLSQECGGHPFVTQLYTHFHDQARICEFFPAPRFFSEPIKIHLWSFYSNKNVNLKKKLNLN